MKNIYDNGYQMLGSVKSIRDEIENGLDKGAIDDEEIFEIYEELKELEDDTIIMINYDNPMGYTLTKWTRKDLVEEGV